MSDEPNIGAWIGGAIGIVVGLALLIWLIRWYANGTFYTKKNRIDGKVVIVTGCNTGIGRETVKELAARGAKVYMACRDISKADETRDAIVRETGNPNVFTRKLDLASFASVREFANNFKHEESRLDILINNAGVMFMPKTLTKDGLEMQMGVNHMAHFLLTNLLLDMLKASAPSRIVILSSNGHAFDKIDKDDLNSDKSYSKYKAYFRSKLANVLFARELTRRLQGTGVTANSVHPGAVKTELQRNTPILSFLSYPFYIFFKTPRAGAQTSLAVALDPDLEKVSGKYFKDCAISKESDAAKDDEMAQWLWDISEEWTNSKLK